MMHRGENSDSIPTDLILEIFSRLPAKSVARFRCLSKLWGSMLSRPYFSDLFLTRSSARPRLLFVVEGDGKWDFFSWPQHPYGKSSLVVAADFQLKFSVNRNGYGYDCSYASGLIHFHKIWIETGKDAASMICNPSTGQYAILPELRTDKDSTSFLGFDPIDKQFKVLVMNYTVHHILTLGTDKVRWRKIQCLFTHEPLNFSICINGVLYYLAQHGGTWRCVIVCFDVRSEKFKSISIDAEFFPYQYRITLINYKGKLGVIKLKNPCDGENSKFCIWVLEDVEKQECSKYAYPLPVNELVDSNRIFVVGVTSTGEIVFLSNFYTWLRFYVFYFNPERNPFQRVEIHGIHEVVESRSCMYAITHHVEDLKFDFMETTYVAASLSPPEQTHKPTSTSSTSPRNDHQVKRSTSTREDHQVKTSTSSGKHHQMRTVAHPRQDRRMFESINRFNALYLVDDDEFTGVKNL